MTAELTEPPVNGHAQASEKESIDAWVRDIIRRKTHAGRGVKKVAIEDWKTAMRLRPQWFSEGNTETESGEESEQGFPKYCSSVVQLCGYYKRRWPEYYISVTNRIIHSWQVGSRIPEGAPVHPALDGNHRLYLQDCFDWFEKWKLPSCPKIAEMIKAGENTNQPGIDELEEEEKRNEIKHKEFIRAKERGDYIERTVATETGIAVVKRIHLRIKNEDERNIPKMCVEKLLSLNVPQESVDAFREWFTELMRSVTDRRESDMIKDGCELKEAE